MLLEPPVRVNARICTGFDVDSKVLLNRPARERVFMSYPMVDGARQNRILAGIPLVHYARILEHLKLVDLSRSGIC